MLDDILEILTQPYLLVYSLVLAVSLFQYPRYYDTPLRYFPVLLMFNVLTEILGLRIIDGKDGSIVLTNFYSNLNWLAYNIYTLVFFLYMLYIYYAYLESTKLRKALLIGVSLLVLTSLANIFIQDFVTVSQVYSYMAGALLVIFFSASYIGQEFRKKETVGIRLHNVLLWISLGNFVFFAGYGPLKVHRTFWESDQWAEIAWIRSAQLVFIYILEFCLLTGFLLMWRMKRPKRNLKPFFSRQKESP